MHLFYTPEIGTGNTLTLNEEESKHAVRVLRLAQGSPVQLIDGRGGFYTAEITSAHPKRVDLTIINHETDFGKRQHYLHIAVAPTKNIDRFEWFVEKATEIGIDEITPVLCEHSERKDLRTDRVNRVIVSAMKQSLKAYKPKLNELTPLISCIKNERADVKAIAHCADFGHKKALKEIVHPGKSTLILIGPEGDFSPVEIELALQAGFEGVTLGSSRLRTETAALEACFEVDFLNR